VEGFREAMKSAMLADFRWRCASCPQTLETPLSVYLKLAGEGPSFLLESVTVASRWPATLSLGFTPQGFRLSRAADDHGGAFRETL